MFLVLINRVSQHDATGYVYTTIYFIFRIFVMYPFSQEVL